MSYNKTVWVDNETIITADALNNIEDGIKINEEAIKNIELIPGPKGDTGPQGIPGPVGIFDTTTEYQELETENKTVLGAINEVNNVKGHTHFNKECLDKLSDSASMLTYNGKVVVNQNEYSFKTLPRKKAPKDVRYVSIEGGRLPWQG